MTSVQGVDIKGYLSPVLFHDVPFLHIQPLLENPSVRRHVYEKLAEPFTSVVDKWVVLDSRGFLLTAPADILDAGVVLARKEGKSPGEVVQGFYTTEYNPHIEILEMCVDAIKPGEMVVICDDVLATGGTIEAVIKMVLELGGIIVGISVIAELAYCGGRDRLARYSYPIHSLVIYDEPPQV